MTCLPPFSISSIPKHLRQIHLVAEFGGELHEELEQVWAGKKTPKEGLDAAVLRGNEQLEKFQKANKG